MALVSRFLGVLNNNHNKASKDNHANHAFGDDKPINNSNKRRSTDPNEKQKSLLSIDLDRSWKRVFTSKQNRGQWAPTLSGIIKAGDEGVYTSALFNNLQAHPGELDLEKLFDVFRGASKTHSMTARPTYALDFSKFTMADTRTRHRRTQSMKVNKEARPELPRQRNSMDLVERGLTRARSRRVTPVLISAFDDGLPAAENRKKAQSPKWSQDVQQLQYIDGKPIITVTSSELEALSILIGNPIHFLDGKHSPESSPLTTSHGAYGISIHTTPRDEGAHHVTLYQHKRGIYQLASRGSGYSPLLAKHLACGSLPYSPDSSTDNTILITSSTLPNLQLGKPLYLHPTVPSDPSPLFLNNLPHANPPTLHTLLPSPTSPSASNITPILLQSIASLPFRGGLVPHASTPLIHTIHFVASAGLPPARLLQRLEALVEKVHQHSPDLQLFSPLLLPQNAGLLFRERERLGKLATGAAVKDSLPDKVARMHRYTTMLERLMALISSSGSAQSVSEIRQAVVVATAREIERSYVDAVAAYNSPSPSPSLEQLGSKARTTKSNPTRHVSGSSHGSNKRSSSASLSAPTLMDMKSPRASSTFPLLNLGRQIEAVLKTELPFGIETVALVARLVIVAWTISVEGVDWEGGDGLGFGGREINGWTMG